MAYFLSKLRAAATKLETSPGTAETLVSADNNVRMWDLAIGSLNVEMDASPSKAATGDFGLSESVPGNQSASISFNTKFWGAGVTVPSWMKFVESCGCDYTTSGTYLTIYPSLNAVNQSITAGIYDIEGAGTASGLFYSFAGCVGNCVISTEGTGKPYKMAFEYMGALSDINDIHYSEIPVTTSLDTAIPDKFMNGTATIGGVSQCISNLEFNFGTTVTPVQCQTSSTGLSQFIITNMEPVLKINPAIQRNSTYDAWGKFTAGTIEEIIVSTSDFTLNIPRGQITSLAVEDSDGILRYSIEIRPLRPTSAGTMLWAPWTIVVI